MKKKIKYLIKRIVFKVIDRNRLIRLLDLTNNSFKPVQDIFEKYGYNKSLEKNLPVDYSGDPIPWYTYPAIEYLLQLNLKDKIVFEWGCGNSSLFFAKKAKKVISVEDNSDWYNKILIEKPENLELRFLENEDFINSIATDNLKFDVIVIDSNHRTECAKMAINHLNKGGIVILDNSDWFKNSAKILRDCNMIQVDFHGFGPINNYTWTTSILFSRDFGFEALNNIQPSYANGGLTHISD